MVKEMSPAWLRQKTRWWRAAWDGADELFRVGFSPNVPERKRPPVQSFELDPASPGPSRLCSGAPDYFRRLVVQQARAVRGPAVHLQGNGGSHILARRNRPPGTGAGDRSHRPKTAGERRRRLP